MSTEDTEITSLKRTHGGEKCSVTETESETGSIRVLHVDDESGVTEITKAFLEENHDDLVIETETDPHAAIERIRSDGVRIDCVVSDYRMPQMNGLELLDAIREYDTDLPFILFTGRGSEEIAAEAIASGVTDYLQKGGTEVYSILSNRIGNVVENYRQQRELDRIHERYQALIENGSDIVCVHETDGTIQYMSPSIEGVLGFDPDRFIGENVFDFIHPDDYDRVTERFSGLQSGEAATEITSRFRCRNAAGEWRWIEAVFADERTSALEGFVVNARDVTEQIARKERLKRQNELLEAVEELASVGGWEYDTRTETLHWTDEIRRIRDLPPEYESTLNEAIEFYHPEDRPRARRAIEAALTRGESFEFECRLRTADGDERWVHTYGAPKREDGSIVRVQGAIVDITERKERERELRTFRTAVENAGHAIYWTDPDGRIEYANPAFEETTGHDREEVVGEPSSVLKSDVHTDAFYGQLWETIISGETWENEIINERKDGERYTVNQTISPITDEGEIQRYIVVSQDITDRKKQRRQLNDLFETTRELLRGETPAAVATTAVEAARDVLGLSISGIHLYDADRDALVPTATTNEATDVIGEIPTFEPNESLAWQAFESGDEAIYDDVQADPNVYDPETDLRSECYLPLGDHGVFLAGSTDPKALDDRIVSLARILAANVEVALDRLDREIELRETSERLQTIIEHTPDALFVLDEDERIVEINQQACTSLGYERGELLGMRRPEIDTATTAQESDPFAPLREGPDTVLTREASHRRKDGSEFPVRVRVTRIEHGDEDRFLAIARDISEVETTKRQLQRQNGRLEEFAGIVSHDLRNPLTVARSGVELARRTGDGCGDTLEQVDRAHDRMQTLIDDLLTLARNGQSIDEADVDRIELSEIVSRGWGIISTGDAELRIEDEPTIVADESRLQQLIENLVRNSVEHGSTSSRTGSDDSVKHGKPDNPPDSDEGVTIRVGALPDGFYIEDDGPGIPESEREAVFDPGYSTREDGTGFGLGIVRNVVDAHGWTVTITESTDGGARFEITDVETAMPIRGTDRS